MAAAITRASAPAQASSTASRISATVAACLISTPAGLCRAVGAVTRITFAPRSRATWAMAYPILPVERLVITLTGSIGSCVPPALTTMRRPAKGPSRPRSARIRPRISSGGARRPGPICPEAKRPATGPTKCTPRSRSVATFACVAGCAHMWLSIAGATSTGAVVAKATQPSRSSAKPCARRARVVAVAGTMANSSACSPKRTWALLSSGSTSNRSV